MLKKQIEKDFHKYKIINQRTLRKLDKLYHKTYEIIKLRINNNKLITDKKKNIKNYIKKSVFPLEQKQRIINNNRKCMIKLIKDALNYGTKNNLIFPNITFYLYIHDDYLWKNPDLPVFVFAKPRNKKGIRFPHFSLTYEWSKDMKYKYIPYNKQKKIYAKTCDKLKKHNKIYFKGGITSQLRSYLSKLKWTIPLEIDLDKKFVLPQYFCKYKYLLDLPGYWAWSFRFNQLIMTNSMIIKIDVYNSTYNEEPWVSTISDLFIPGRDYHEIIYVGNQRKISNNTNIQMKINKTYLYYEKNKDEYNSIVKNMTTKANKITNELIYRHIYNLLQKYKSIIHLNNNRTRYKIVKSF